MVEKFSNEYLTKIVANNISIDAINGIGPKYKRKLNDIGIRTTNDLLKRALRAKNRRKLFSETDLSLTDLYEWAGMASLLIVNGIGPKYAHILSEAGVHNIGQLSSQSSTLISEMLSTLKSEKPRLVDSQLSRKRLEVWINEAKIISEALGLPKPYISNVTPATLNELDFQIHDFLDFQCWDSLSRFGVFLQELSASKARELREKEALRSVKEESRTPLRGHRGRDKASRSKIEFPARPYNPISQKREVIFASRLASYGTYLSSLRKISRLPMAMSAPAINEDASTSIEAGDLIQEYLAKIYERTGREFLGPVSENLNDLDKKLDDVFKGIYKCLVSRDLKELERFAAVNLWRIDSLLNEIALAWKKLRVAIYSTTNPSEFEIRLTVKLSTLLEKTTVLYGVLIYYMAINSGPQVGASGILKDEIANATGKNVVFESQVLRRSFIPLSELIVAKGKYDGSTIETCGMVEHDKEWFDSNNLYFFLKQGVHTKIVLAGYARKSILPPKGSFVVLSGKLRNTASEPTIEVEKFEPTTSQKKGWMDYILRAHGSQCSVDDYCLQSDRFIRFPETARRIIRCMRGVR